MSHTDVMTRCNVFLFTCSVLTDVSASKPHSYHYHCSLSWPLPRRDAVLHARILHEATLSWLLSPELSSTNTHRLSPLPIKLSISYQYSSTLFIIIYILVCYWNHNVVTGTWLNWNVMCLSEALLDEGMLLPSQRFLSCKLFNLRNWAFHPQLM